MLNVININDNITLNYIPMQKLKTVTAGMYIHRELKKDEASKNALLPHVLKRGCKLCRNSVEIAHYLENLYGAKFSAGIIKSGEDHILCFETETISDKYAPDNENLTEKAVELLLSVVFKPLDTFDDGVFEQERKNSITKIESIINDKRVYANYRCQEEMCKGEKFAIPRLGYAKDMAELTKEELYDYYKSIIISSPIDIYVCGDTDISAVEKQIRQFVDGFEFTKGTMPESTIIHKSTPVKNVVEKLDVTQGKLSIGFTTDIGADDDRYWGLVLANAIFGGGAQSKLFNNVREKLSLAYYAGSFIEKYKGIMMVNAGIEFKNFERAYGETMVQLDEMKKGNITDLEFESSKGFLINSLNSYYDDQKALIMFYIGEKVAGTNLEIEDCKEKIKNVTRSDVVSAMQSVKADTVYFLTGKEDE